MPDEQEVSGLSTQWLIFDSAKTTNWDALGPTIIIDGRIAGTWKGTVEKNQLTIEANTVRDLKRREKLAITEAAEQYATFLAVALRQATVRS